MSSSARKVQEALTVLGVSCKVHELPSSTRSAADAANSIGCSVSQIVKSLVFRTVNTDRAILALVSGSNKVNEAKLGEQINEPIGKADADFVREKTGFAIGGIPPVGHLERLTTLFDKDLLNFPEVWAAAGTPHAVFQINPHELLKITKASILA